MKKERLYDIDWLRVLGMLLVFVFHCLRFFNDEDWHVKNSDLSQWASIFVSITWRFMMPLFFVVSAAASYYALASRSGGQYVLARVKRLLIPFLFGTFVLLIPIQVWIERVTHGQSTASFLEWYPGYFQGWYGFGGNFAWMGLHLWYLEMLFLYSLLTLPLFLFLQRESAQPLNSKLAGFLGRPYTVLFTAIPLLLMELWVRKHPDSIGISAFGGWPPFSYLVMFLVGYLMTLDPRYREAARKSRWAALALGAISVAILLPQAYTGRSFSMPYPVYFTLNSFNTYFWLIAAMGFAASHLTFSNRFLKYANEAVLPFYILHQTVIVVVGFVIRQWQIAVLPKFFILTAVSFAVIMLLYEGLIRRFRPLRFLFGVRP